jgi:DNA-binding NarL/FixJ family response regulator
VNTEKSRQIFILEDQLLVRMALKDLLAEMLPPDCEVQEFPALCLLEQACQQAVPALIIADLSVLDAGPARVFEFLITQVPNEIPVIITTANVEYQYLLRDQARFAVFPKGETFEILYELLYGALKFSPA